MISTSDGFELETADETAQQFKSKRGPYRKSKTTPVEILGDGFEILLEESIPDVFEYATPEEHDRLPQSGHRKNRIDSNKMKPICFIDGEGANAGDKEMTLRKKNLRRWVQKQNYALLGAVLEPDEYRCIVGKNNTQQLTTRECLNFILELPDTHILIGYALTYDIEHWLKSISPEKMDRLMRTGFLWWRGYRLNYIPKKMFRIRKGKKSKTVYDVFGFFQCSFEDASKNWRIGNPERNAFISRMKKLRSDFGPITEETKEYNKAEGINGIEMFTGVRREYMKLELSLPHPVGAGSIASAMFRKHSVLDYGPTFRQIPVEIMLSAFIGGRFDVTRVGFVGDIFESDINSAYPHIARNLPCLRCGRFVRATEYQVDRYGLWLARWKDNETRWSPFPYRTHNGHIRYYADGTGFYYGEEIEAALRFDPTIEILGGYRFEINCDHKPFGWIEEYYQRRQEMLKTGDFAEQIIKYGLNSVYGKLAQTKSKSRYQNLIWAGMITSGTRAMLLDGVRQNPNAVIKIATDALFSTVPLQLEYDETKLGAWKTETLNDLLILGNGVYQSTGSSSPKHPNGIARNRGFARDSKVEFNWEQIRKDYRNGVTSIGVHKEFRGFTKAYRENKLEERCNWIDFEVEIKLDLQKQKRKDGELIWPLPNETPGIISGPSRIDPNLLNIPGLPTSLNDQVGEEHLGN